MTDPHSIGSLEDSNICRAIAAALQTAIENDMPDMMHENDLQRANGKGQFRWNFIIRNLRSASLVIVGMRFDDPARGAWHLALVYDEGSKTLFSLMSRGTFNDVRDKAIDKKHYLAALAQFNTNYTPAQVSLFDGCDTINEDWVDDAQAQLTEMLSNDIERHVLLVFDCKFDKVVDLEGIILAPNMEISERVPLGSLLMKPFDTTQKTIQPNANDDDDEDFLVELR